MLGSRRRRLPRRPRAGSQKSGSTTPRSTGQPPRTATTWARTERWLSRAWELDAGHEHLQKSDGSTAEGCEPKRAGDSLAKPHRQLSPQTGLRLRRQGAGTHRALCPAVPGTFTMNKGAAWNEPPRVTKVRTK